MQYPLVVAGFENHEIVVVTAGFWSGPKLLVDGEPAPKGPKRGQFLLSRADGSEAIASFKINNFLDAVPQVVIDGSIHQVAEPLKWYQWVWSALPLALALIGGALGGLFGGLALAINGRIFRSKLKGVAKYLATGLVSIGAVIVFFISATVFNLALQGLTPALAKEFKSEAGRFSIMTPYALKESTQSVDTKAGKIDLHLFVADKGNKSYMVMYSDYPAEAVKASDPEKMLDGSRDGAVSNIHGQLISEAHIAFDGFPGRDLTISAKNEKGQAMTLRIHYFLVENRLYQVLAIYTSDQENKAEIDGFLTSFKLIGK